MEINITKINLNPNAGGGGTSSIELQEKSITITENGTREITPDADFGGLSMVKVKVDNSDLGKPKLPNGICLSRSTWKTFDMNDYDWSLVYNYTEMFYSCQSVSTITLAPQIKPLTCYKMFYNCLRLQHIIGIEDMDVSNVVDMSSMFDNCSFTSLDLSKWDTSKVTDMYGLFNGCIYLTELKMGGDVSSVNNVTSMFSGISTDGTFYYNEKYDYSKIIAVLPKRWTAVPMTITD